MDIKGRGNSCTNPFTAAVRLALLTTCSLCSTVAFSQETGGVIATAPDDKVAATAPEIIVTGSRLRRPSAQGSSPLSVTDRSTLEASGQASLANVIADLTINTGSQFNTDLQGQGGTVGTGGFNLRGLGLNSTLVLINGFRSVEYAINNNVGDTFVDVNSLVPQIAIKRIDILKDGAAALYGSDAVAGVANFVTRSDFNGFEIEAGGQDVASGGQRQFDIAGIAGGGTDQFRGLLAISYSDRSLFSTDDQPELTAGRDISPLSFPGSFLPLAFLPNASGQVVPTPVGPPMLDPLCGDPRVGGLPNAQVPGLCSGDVTAFNTLIPSDRRFQAYAEVSYRPSDGVKLSADFTYAKSKSEALGYPGNPLLFTVFVPANNPGNPFTFARPFGPPGSGQFAGDRMPTLFLGRAFGPRDEGVTYVFRHDLYRTGLNAEFALPRDWVLNTHYGYSRSDAQSDRPDLDRAEFLRAVSGRGGPNGNQFFNPFANARLAAPGTAQFNDPAVIERFRTVSTENLSRDLHNVVVSANGDVFSLPGGSAALAVGGEFRRERIDADFSDLANQDGLAFFLGDPDFAGQRTVWAGFAELGLPITDRLDVQLAARWERYPSGSSFDPKVGVSYRASNSVTIRGTWGTSFRAPNLFQLFGFTTGVEAIDDKLTGQSNTNPSIRTTRNADLANENSRALSLGLDLKPVSRLRFSVDYWRFRFQDRIVREVAQQAVDADAASRRAGGAGDPRVIRNPATLGISRIDLSFINAAKLSTDGVDVALTYAIPTSTAGRFSLTADATRVFNYDIQQNAGDPVIRGNGNRNFNNIGVSSPKLRANAGLEWLLDPISASITARHISSYDDDRVGGGKIGSHSTLDAQVNLTLAHGLNDGRVKLTVGAINLTDNLPPEAVSQQGFDASVHDPRGRVIYAKIKTNF